MKSCDPILRLLLVALVLCAPLAEGAPNKRDPHIGYLYPAGGQQGTVFELTAGGQFLKGATNVYISGQGVTAKVGRYVQALRKKDEQAIRKRMGYMGKVSRALKKGTEPPEMPEDMPDLPDHPLVEGMEEMDAQELKDLRMKLFDPKKQPNSQLGDTVEIEVSIDPDAPPGDRELRLGTRNGLTNPLRFQVGVLPEVSEQEPNNLSAADDPFLVPPVLVNGQIRPGDVDRFQLRARKGQRILLDARARRLIPYLADAVPGWFQAILTLYDSEGQEVAYADDYRYHPDPHLSVEIPTDGIYELEIRDAIYRGREDFVYRIAVTDAPPEPEEFSLDTEDGEEAVTEKEPNDTRKKAERIELPHLVEGRIGQPGDVDVFRFKGEADEEVVAEVFARRQLDSPVDSVLKLTDASGDTIEWNDDFMEKDGHLHRGAGLLTHHADSYISARLPKAGVYFVSVEDAQAHGGEEYAYRLRITPPQPDFELRVTPSSLSIPPGHTVAIEVHVLRRDGFDGEIDLALANAPKGFSLAGARIPGGKDRLRMTLTTPWKGVDEPVALQVEGRARIGDGDVVHQAVPADDTMQAFLWRHLVPAQEFLVSVAGRKRPAPPLKRLGNDPVQITPGGTFEIRMRVPKQKHLMKDIRWELNQPPEGIALAKTRVEDSTAVFVLEADGEKAKAGLRDNLIVEAVLMKQAGGKEKKGGKKNKRISLGFIPAIPLEIMNP